MQKNIHTDISAYMNMEEGRNPKRHRNNVAEDTGGLTAIIPARSRWRPTGDQRQILERLYEQGIRKPSADQIQQITARLKTLGPIEPKNVFYWFHNFKAKLRLKLKQVQVHEQSSTMLNIPSHDVTTRTVTSLVRNPCFQERDSNAKRCIYTSSVTSTSARSSVSLEKELASNIPRNETDGKRLSADHGSRYKYGCRPVDSSDEVNDENTAMISNNSSENSKTLVLFPLTPTSGILRGRDYREAEKCVLE